jgi:hypothetical protein
MAGPDDPQWIRVGRCVQMKTKSQLNVSACRADRPRHKVHEESRFVLFMGVAAPVSALPMLAPGADKQGLAGAADVVA